MMILNMFNKYKIVFKFGLTKENKTALANEKNGNETKIYLHCFVNHTGMRRKTSVDYSSLLIATL